MLHFLLKELRMATDCFVWVMVLMTLYFVGDDGGCPTASTGVCVCGFPVYSNI